eukprot:6485714-Amphidinium_carterae.1
MPSEDKSGPNMALTLQSDIINATATNLSELCWRVEKECMATPVRMTLKLQLAHWTPNRLIVEFVVDDSSSSCAPHILIRSCRVPFADLNCSKRPLAHMTPVAHSHRSR